MAIYGTATGGNTTRGETPAVLGFLALGRPPSLHFRAAVENPLGYGFGVSHEESFGKLERRFRALGLPLGSLGLHDRPRLARILRKRDPPPAGQPLLRMPQRPDGDAFRRIAPGPARRPDQGRRFGSGRRSRQAGREPLDPSRPGTAGTDAAHRSAFGRADPIPHRMGQDGRPLDRSRGDLGGFG